VHVPAGRGYFSARPNCESGTSVLGAFPESAYPGAADVCERISDGAECGAGDREDAGASLDRSVAQRRIHVRRDLLDASGMGASAMGSVGRDARGAAVWDFELLDEFVLGWLCRGDRRRAGARI